VNTIDSDTVKTMDVNDKQTYNTFQELETEDKSARIDKIEAAIIQSCCVDKYFNFHNNNPNCQKPKKCPNSCQFGITNNSRCRKFCKQSEALDEIIRTLPRSQRKCISRKCGLGNGKNLSSEERHCAFTASNYEQCKINNFESFANVVVQQPALKTAADGTAEKIPSVPTVDNVELSSNLIALLKESEEKSLEEKPVSDTKLGLGRLQYSKPEAPKESEKIGLGRLQLSKSNDEDNSTKLTPGSRPMKKLVAGEVPAPVLKSLGEAAKTLEENGIDTSSIKGFINNLKTNLIPQTVQSQFDGRFEKKSTSVSSVDVVKSSKKFLRELDVKLQCNKLIAFNHNFNVDDDKNVKLGYVSESDFSDGLEVCPMCYGTLDDPSLVHILEMVKTGEFENQRDCFFCLNFYCEATLQTERENHGFNE